MVVVDREAAVGKAFPVADSTQPALLLFHLLYFFWSNIVKLLQNASTVFVDVIQPPFSRFTIIFLPIPFPPHCPTRIDFIPASSF
jgi:hypothetical protein